MKLARDSAEINPFSLGEYLYLGSVGPSRSLFTKTHKVAPGEIVVWEYSSSECIKKSRVEAVDCHQDNSIEIALRNAVERRVASDGFPYGVFASGGLDSALVAAIAREVTGDSPPLYHASISDKRFDESSQVKQLGNVLGSKVNIVHFDEYVCAEVFETQFHLLDEPIADPSLLPTLCVAELASEDVKYVLTGDGADDLFAGYDLFLAKLMSEKIGQSAALAASSKHASVKGKIVESAEVKLALKRMRSWPQCLAMSHVRAPFTLDEIDELVRDRYRLPAGQLAQSLISDFYDLKVLGSLPDSADRSTVIRHFLQCRILSKLDRATMLKGIEGRSPFLDEAVVQMSFAYDFDDLIKGGVTKQPVHLLNNPLRQSVDHHLSKHQIENDGIFKWPVVESHLKDMRSGASHSAQKIWTLLCFQKVVHSYSNIQI